MADTAAAQQAPPPTTSQAQPPAEKQYRHIGRPRKWTHPEQILDAADEYFNSRMSTKEPITITGMCRHIGTTRQQLLDYCSEGRQLSAHNDIADGVDSAKIVDALKRVKARCEEYAEEHIFTARNPAGGIFALKNYGWKDTQTVETVGFVEHRADPDTLRVLSEFLGQLAAPRLPAQADVVEVNNTADIGKIGQRGTIQGK